MSNSTLLTTMTTNATNMTMTLTAMTSNATNMTTTVAAMTSDNSSLVYNSTPVTSSTEENSGILDDEYQQLALAAVAILGICVVLVIFVVLLVYRKNRSLEMGKARQTLGTMEEQIKYLRQVNFTQRQGEKPTGQKRP
ncbi:uncharacterized protein LOC143284074 isoform X2 [Babylonia areolata]|uniref:uncharacterized protein LOC143284074 isoform X2 n=1 Tax=Babylonia areolata TaxID=304850 RepID=UPI003FD1E1A1